MLAALALVFDMTSVLAMMYPGRERIEVEGADGVTYVYACKPGPAGETPEVQAGKAQAAFEENTAKFAEMFVGEMMQDIEADAPTLGMALDMTRKTNSWAGSMTTHLEKTYGCALLG
jgi:hypothetical protein